MMRKWRSSLTMKSLRENNAANVARALAAADALETAKKAKDGLSWAIRLAEVINKQYGLGFSPGELRAFADTIYLANKRKFS